MIPHKSVRRFAPLLIAIVFAVSACATTGPSASRQEIAKARQTLEAKRTRHQLKEEARLLRVGYRILQNLPEEVRDREIPFVGLRVRELSKKEVRNAFSTGDKSGLVVVGLLTREAAVEGELEVGDLIQSVQGKPVTREREYHEVISHLKPGTVAKLKVKRKEAFFETKVPVQTIWREITFSVNGRKKEVNAYATLFGIQFTLPMMNFLRNDDELAVITGHEIAHIVKGHVGKSMGTATVAGLLGGLAAIPLNLLLPGAGSVVSFFVTSGIQAKFSQEFEKEADYLGLLLAYRAGYDIRQGTKVWERFEVELPKHLSWGFLNTHPSTPERFVRTEKVIQELSA